MVACRGGLAVVVVVMDFGVAYGSVRRWIRQADVDQGIKDELTTAG